MKKKSRSEMDREILSSVKKEMEKPRLTTSVRESLETRFAQSAKGLVARAVNA